MSNKKSKANKDYNSIQSYRVLGHNYSVSNSTFETLLNNNDLVVGSTGSGKTRSYVMSLLDNISENMIVVDTKGLLYNKYIYKLKHKDYSVIRLNFNDYHKSVRYNPFDFISYDEETQSYNMEEIETLAHTLCPDSLDKSDGNYWTENARLMLESMICYTLEALPKSERHIGSVIELFSNWNYDIYDNLFKEHSLSHPDSFAYSKYLMAQQVRNAEKTSSCIKSFVSAALKPFIDKSSQYIFQGESDFRFEDFSDQKTVFFVDVSDNDRSKDSVISIFYTQLFQYLIRTADKQKDGRLKYPVRVIMDDFASGVKIPNLDGIINIIRSRNICMSIIIQSLEQLEGIYNKSISLNIQNACDHVIFLGNTRDNDIFARMADMDVNDFIDAIGLYNEYVYERGHSHGVIVPKYNFNNH